MTTSRGQLLSSNKIARWNTLVFWILVAMVATNGSPVRAEPVPVDSYAAPIRVACVGDSITFGYGIREGESHYPAVLGRWLGNAWDVRNFGVNSVTLLQKGDKPYIKQKAFSDALAFNPDVLVVALGTNDSKQPTMGIENVTNNWQFKADFARDYRDLIGAFRKANPKIRAYICLPPPVFSSIWGMNNLAIRAEMAPAIRNVARDANATIIDFYGPLQGQPTLFSDTVHPKAEGTALLAAEVFRALTNRQAPETGNRMTKEMSAFRDDDRVLFQGDSITDGNRGRNADPNHILGHGYAFIIAAKNGAQFPQRRLTFINRGVSGNKVSDLAARWSNEAITLKPNLISILIGVNDASSKVPLDQFERDYDKLLSDTVAALPGVRLVLCEPFSLPVGKKKEGWDAWFADIQARQAAVERLGTKYQAAVVHFQATFDEAAKRAPAEYWIWDGIHPTYAGHQLMSQEWERVVNQFWR